MRLGVAGAGTMGSGIAQLGAAAGMKTRLHDPDPGALRRGLEGARDGLTRWIEKERAPAESLALLHAETELSGLAGCDLVIEAAPERRQLKRELFERLSAVAPEAVLATNTSSIPVTALAGAAARPERVVGMHFFNPPPLMGLVEVVAAEQTGDEALALAREAGEAMGKRVIRAADGPGFLVNRCGRPFGGEALRLLTERVATVEQIDRVCRLGGGFRMGPFELMDLVGIDVGLEVARSFTELSFGEPRWRPSPLQQKVVDAGRLGRKSGRGWYRYDDGRHRPEDPAAGDEPPALAEVREAAEAQGLRWSGQRSPSMRRDPSLTGFYLVPGGRLVELSGARSGGAERLFASMSLEVEWLERDAPGGVLGRIVCQLVNEAAFAIGEGVGSAADVDAGMTLGLNHPRGPVAWGEAIGLEEVLVTLEALWVERREERYRSAPLLRRAVALGVGLEEASA
ncbi:MAG TPA: 3-hydroxyacyl-CoA dehydrogenase NAD-binding domain-containing protein [Thermoleophilaceae bacterium]|nr:3-hydroxyacyl-CoA dehydrogenase NAD-binding domain-containing protein [Thermoleophilaceae bacterium]